jgi:GWxTD domain-containing protein
MTDLNFGKSAEYPPGTMQHLRSRALALAGLWLLFGCGPWQRVGTDEAPDPSVIVPRLFDPAPIYRQMGLFAQAAPLAFVGVVRAIAGPTPDSALIVFGLSVANSQLSFRRSDEGFEARYRAEARFERDGRLVRHVASEEAVRVGAFAETLRTDESVIFQQFVTVPADSYTVHVSIRDLHGDREARDRRAVVVPRLGTGSVTLLPVFATDAVRDHRATVPSLLLNPRATIPFGLDSLRLLIEVLDDTAGSVGVAVRTPQGRIVAQASHALTPGRGLHAARVAIAPAELPVGEITVVVTRGADSTMLPALVSFSDQWAIANFDEVLSLLRYFGAATTIAEMREADPADRPALWRDFWIATDPDPVTPEHEALEQYFRRVQEANRRFMRGGDRGWLSDRGEVFIVLGEPDEILDQSSDFQSPRRLIRWNYFTERLTLDFVDDGGFGRFRLTPGGRAEFQRVRERQERAR